MTSSKNFYSIEKIKNVWVTQEWRLFSFRRRCSEDMINSKRGKTLEKHNGSAAVAIWSLHLQAFFSSCIWPFLTGFFAFFQQKKYPELNWYFLTLLLRLYSCFHSTVVVSRFTWTRVDGCHHTCLTAFITQALFVGFWRGFLHFFNNRSDQTLSFVCYIVCCMYEVCVETFLSFCLSMIVVWLSHCAVGPCVSRVAKVGSL